MKMFSYEGMMTPTFAPFTSNGTELNLSIIPMYADYLLNQGIKGIFIHGTCGEGLSMTVEERKQVTDAWVKAAQPRSIKVIAVISAICLKDSKELARHAKSVGVSAIAAFPPLFDKPSAIEDLIDYCKEIADSVPDLPFFYYHIPFKTGVTLSMKEFLTQGSRSIPSLSGMKFTSFEVAGEGLTCLQAEGRKFTVFTGFDQTLAESVCLGYKCAINMSSNFLGRVSLKIFDLGPTIHLDSAKQEAKRHQKTIDDVLKYIFSFTGGAFNVAAAKAAMSIISGLDLGPTRKPCKPLDPKVFQEMKQKIPAFMTKI